MTDIICKRCNKIESDNVKCPTCNRQLRFGLHHLMPKYTFLNPKEADKHGRRYLCSSCHNLLHHMLEAILFKKYIPKNKREEAKEFIKAYSLRWIDKEK